MTNLPNNTQYNQTAPNTKTLIVGGGCFWCTEALFQQIKGVRQVISGYSGGKLKNPTYREVCSGLTGHAEVVQITYNPNLISYEQLLYIHLLTHNPTTLNRQGADRGTQYRSIIFYKSAEELAVAKKVIAKVQKELSDSIVTELKEEQPFYIAEEHHQNYYKNNPHGGYCQAVIDPKLKKLRANLAEWID